MARRPTANAPANAGGAVMLATVLAIASAGCKRDDFVVETIAAADALAADMVATVQGARTVREGVADAETLLQTRRTELEDRVVELKRLRGYQMSDGLQARWRDAFIDDVAALEAMRARLRTQTATDPATADALERLIAAYVAIVSATPASRS